MINLMVISQMNVPVSSCNIKYNRGCASSHAKKKRTLLLTQKNKNSALQELSMGNKQQTRSMGKIQKREFCGY